MASAYQIESDIPLPPKAGGKGGGKYPFREMQPGDSFAIPLTGEIVRGTNSSLDRATQRLSMAAHQMARRAGFKFTVRTLRDEGVARVWRLK